MVLAGDGKSAQVRWGTEPTTHYMVQSSPDLATWTDQEYWMSRTSSLSSAVFGLGSNNATFYRIKQLTEPPERAYITKKVLVLNYDPILTNHSGVRLHQ